MRTVTRVLVAGGAVVVVGSSGSAYTDGNTITTHDDQVGYVAQSVTGAVVNTVKHTLSADGRNIASSALTFTTDLKPNTVVRAGFGAGTAPASLVTCVVTQGTAGNPDTALCDYAAASVTYPTGTSTQFAVTVN